MDAASGEPAWSLLVAVSDAQLGSHTGPVITRVVAASEDAAIVTYDHGTDQTSTTGIDPEIRRVLRRRARYLAEAAIDTTIPGTGSTIGGDPLMGPGHRRWP
ncbi:hypothetical protein SAMN05443637_109115 [Pseudonocardia thermophila]|uniref:Uncharacterized protein n=1 Tax=Pseudonocardia thermophila TaxID=1848 RepID=A0A1M6U3X1_PSETH|nr:hypothetical protein SAMN05443637_109115 [Pseudonocardia thermophila]